MGKITGEPLQAAYSTGGANMSVRLKHELHFWEICESEQTHTGLPGGPFVTGRHVYDTIGPLPHTNIDVPYRFSELPIPFDCRGHTRNADRTLWHPSVFRIV